MPLDRTPAVDIHAHYYPPAYVAEVAQISTETGPHAERARAFLGNAQIHGGDYFTDDLSRRLDLMDAAGIGKQVVSFASGAIWHPREEVRERLVRTFNDACAQACSQAPDRFGFLASVPFPYTEAALRESERVAGLPGCLGVSMPTHIEGVPPDDQRWYPVYEQWNRRRLAVLVHPDGFCAPGVLDDYSMEWGIGAPFEDTIVSVRLICSDLRARFPDIRWIIPHLGGTLPFLLHRLQWRWSRDAQFDGTADRAGTTLAGLYFDTANCSSDTLELACRTLPAGSLLFGSDFPFLDTDDLGRQPEIIRTALPREQSDQVLSGSYATIERDRTR